MAIVGALRGAAGAARLAARGAGRIAAAGSRALAVGAQNGFPTINAGLNLAGQIVGLTAVANNNALPLNVQPLAANAQLQPGQQPPLVGANIASSPGALGAAGGPPVATQSLETVSLILNAIMGMLGNIVNPRAA